MKKEALEKIEKLPLIVEMFGKVFWGRVEVNNNLIVDSANTIENLIVKIKRSIRNIEKADVVDFEISFDLGSFFDEYSFLNASDIAKRADISPALMRQYSAGIKFPSEERVRKIQQAIRVIGKQLAKVKLHRKAM